ncbi:MAG: flavodoxin domain-containing protein [Acutalibacter sp.]|jgi:menaquinone-dependent protoporphyrinogen IX oxidase
MKKIILYGSQYGTAKKYAEKCAEITGLPVANCKKVRDLKEYDLVVYFGALYAGNITGLKRTAQAMGDHGKLILVTVGLTDVSRRADQDNFQASLRSQVPPSILGNMTMFHLGGRMDYHKLNLKHRALIALFCQTAKNLPEEKKTADVNVMIQAYRSKVDLVDLDSLEPIAAAIPH